MIFDSECIEALVAEWLLDKDPGVLDAIMLGSLPLAEVIASQFSDDDVYRQDLINECMVRLHYCLPKYNPEYSLHKYLTSVFRNRCITYIQKQERVPNIELDEPVQYGDISTVLDELIIANRQRFPSVPAEELDQLTHHIFQSLVEGIKPRMFWQGLTRHQVAIVYRSSMVWLRRHYVGFADARYIEPGEFTLLPELREILGDAAYTQVRIAFAGMSIPIPA